MALRYSLILLIFAFCFQINRVNAEDVSLRLEADANAWQAQAAFNACLDFMNGWLAHRDPETGLIPRNLTGSDYWNAKDAAADNYPFMVLTASMIDRLRFETTMKDMLETEIRLTNRLHNLPDDYVFETQSLVRPASSLDTLIFGGSEYVKDGLIPLMEWMGPSPWADRMIAIQDSIWDHAPVETSYGAIPSTNDEINGEQLQVLCRLYWMTGDDRYREWAFRISDYYFLEHSILDADRLSLDDHGCEIISGLAGAYYLASHVDERRQRAYREPMVEILDAILEHATNDDGLFHMFINPRSGEVLREELTDNWGYDYNAVLNVGLLDGVDRYVDATRHALENIHKYVHYPWEGGGSDGYSDSIEGGLNLLNRIPVESGFQWVDDSMEILLAKQREDGVIEGWHGDGNFGRTVLMYALWKTQGTRLHPWRGDLAFGASRDGDALYLSIYGDWTWQGEIQFDRVRHQELFHLPSDYPRINQFPEWYTVRPELMYLVSANGGESETVSGVELIEGYRPSIPLTPGQPLYLFVQPKSGGGS